MRQCTRITSGSAALLLVLAGARPALACQAGAPGCGGVPPLNWTKPYPTLIHKSASAGSNDQLWPAQNLVTGGIYSSHVFPSAANSRGTAVATWPGRKAAISAVVLRARMVSGRPAGFPSAYDVYVTNPANNAWSFLGNYSKQPNAQGVLSIPVSGNPVSYGAMVVPTTIGKDNVGNYVFQLAGLELAQSGGVSNMFQGSNSFFAAGETEASSVGFASGNDFEGFNPGAVTMVADPMNPGWHNIYNSSGGVSQSVFLDGQDTMAAVSGTGNSAVDDLQQIIGGAAVGLDSYGNETYPLMNADGSPFTTDSSTAAWLAGAAGQGALQSFQSGGSLRDMSNAAYDAAQQFLAGQNAVAPNGLSDDDFDSVMSGIGSVLDGWVSSFDE